MIDAEKIEELESKATPGPFELCEVPHPNGADIPCFGLQQLGAETVGVQAYAMYAADDPARAKADAELDMTLRNALPALLETLSAIRPEDECRKAFDIDTGLVRDALYEVWQAAWKARVR